MLQRISLSTADGRELFSGVSLLRSEPPPPPPARDHDDDDAANEEDSQVRATSGGLFAKKSAPSNDNGSRVASQSGLRAAVLNVAPADESRA